jgi:RHS repeat-associated protein
VTRTFDNDFRLATQSINGGNTVSFTYDADSFLTQAGGLTLTRNAQNGLLTGATLGNLTDSWSTNVFGERTGATAAFSGTNVFAQQLTRDQLGRITEKTETIGGVADTLTYGYDLAGRLTEVWKNGVLTAGYTYDGNGNRLTGPVDTTTYTYDAQDRLAQWSALNPPSSTVYGHTANGERVTRTTGGQTASYDYDALGNLMGATLPNGTRIDYLVDGRNRRIGKKVNDVLVQGFLYQGRLRPIAELDGSNALVARFVYATRANVPDYLIKGGSTYRIITDPLGSPRLVVNAATGETVQRMDYDEFGKVTNDTNPGFQPFGFAGGLYDPQTQLVRFGARDYDAETGRWTAKDPIGFEGGDPNLYAYVFSDPINRTDLTGTQPTTPRPPPNPPSALVKKLGEESARRFMAEHFPELLKRARALGGLDPRSDALRSILRDLARGRIKPSPCIGPLEARELGEALLEASEEWLDRLFPDRWMTRTVDWDRGVTHWWDPVN